MATVVDEHEEARRRAAKREEERMLAASAGEEKEMMELSPVSEKKVGKENESNPGWIRKSLSEEHEKRVKALMATWQAKGIECERDPHSNKIKIGMKDWSPKKAI